MATPLDKEELRALRKKARTATLAALRALGGEARRDAIRKWALAHGGFTSRELAAPPPEKAAGKYRRLVDHQLSWELTNLKRDGLVESPKWGTWRLMSAALSSAATAVQEPVDAERLAELRAMPYSRYLRTPEWRRTRTAALMRAGYACSLDMTHTEGLEVHHRSYENLGAELVTDLVVLCHPCHELHHHEHGRLRRDPSIAPQPLRGVLDSVASTPLLQPDGVAPAPRIELGERGRPSLFHRLLTRWLRTPSSPGPTDSFFASVVEMSPKDSSLPPLGGRER